ncbi:MAG: hypothetical protein QNJ97_25625 [Myxococcota bacterium]|nr:hypothetical protein [Myxococcota bacterium]
MRQKKKIVSLLLLALCFTCQVDTVLHLFLTPHAICKHGKIVEADTETGQPTHDPEDTDNPNHKGSQVLARLTSVETFVHDDLVLHAIDRPLETRAMVSDGAAALLCGSDIYRLSPCNSPPSLG